MRRRSTALLIGDCRPRHRQQSPDALDRHRLAHVLVAATTGTRTRCRCRARAPSLAMARIRRPASLGPALVEASTRSGCLRSEVVRRSAPRRGQSGESAKSERAARPAVPRRITPSGYNSRSTHAVGEAVPAFNGMEPLPKAQTPVIAQAPVPPSCEKLWRDRLPCAEPAPKGQEARSGEPSPSPAASKLSGKRTEGRFHAASASARRGTNGRPRHVPDHACFPARFQPS